MEAPRHIAIIMDGNGRWARSRGLERTAGHLEGVNAVHRVTEAANDLGVKYLTLYAFSTENWHRPKAEVDVIMHLIAMAIERETPEMIRNNVQVGVIGDLESLPPEAASRLARCMAQTAHCTGLRLTLAISYSARWEITRATRLIAAEVAEGTLRPEDITDETVAAHLATAGLPDPDLLIRTGGEHRISNYLLWQIAYTELYVTPIYWPDFGGEQLAEAINDYNRRQRRFGLTGDQVAQPQ